MVHTVEALVVVAVGLVAMEEVGWAVVAAVMARVEG